MNLDYGRQMDLEDLSKLMKETRDPEYKKYLEKLAYNIFKQSTQISSLRDEMLRAFRVGDMGKVNRIRLHIQAVRLEETRGDSWGSNRTEKKIDG